MYRVASTDYWMSMFVTIFHIQILTKFPLFFLSNPNFQLIKFFICNKFTNYAIPVASNYYNVQRVKVSPYSTTFSLQNGSNMVVVTEINIYENE
jgi:ABC-type multidrug transport system permease subunit